MAFAGLHALGVTACRSYPGGLALEIDAAPWKMLVLELGKRLKRRLGRRPPSPGSFHWSVKAVTDTEGPALNVRNYIERRNLREVVKMAGGRVAGELGCGYGRLTMVLSEFYHEVHGFEREAELLEIARGLLPSITFHRVATLRDFGRCVPGSFDLLMTNAVLQHIPDQEVIAILEVAKAHLSSTGHLLLAEKTETSEHAQLGDQLDGSVFLSRGRSVETWTRWVAPLTLKHTRAIEVEPTYRSDANRDFRNVGTLMLFGR